MSAEITGALKLANGTFAPAVIVHDYGDNYMALVADTSRRRICDAVKVAKRALAVNPYHKLNDHWTLYTNASSVLEYLRQQDFVF